MAFAFMSAVVPAIADSTKSNELVVERFDELIKKYGLTADQIRVEITETASADSRTWTRMMKLRSGMRLLRRSSERKKKSEHS